MKHLLILTKTIVTLAIVLSFHELSFSQPKWAKKIPVDNNFYIGIAMCEKEGNTDYQDIARNKALATIASNIAVTLVSETSHQVIEEAGLFDDSFKSNVSSFAKAKLHDYELVEKWENKKQYWVYYRLSKEKYKLAFEKSKRMAIKQASQYFSLAENALKGNNKKSALIYFSKTAIEIAPFRGLGLKYTEDSKRLLDVETYTRLNKLLIALQVKSTIKTIEVHKYETNFPLVLIHISMMDESGKMNAIDDIPFTVKFLKGTVKYNAIQNSQMGGNSNFQITAINGDKNIGVKIIPDLYALAGTQPEANSLAFDGLSLPELLLNVNIVPPTVYIESLGNTLGDNRDNSMLTKKISEKFSELGWLVADTKTTADFYLKADITTRKGSEMQGIYTAFAKGSIHFSKQDSNKEISSITFSEVSNGGASYEQAGSKAVSRLADTITEKLYQFLVEF